jgi:hypothetical protein
MTHAEDPDYLYKFVTSRWDPAIVQGHDPLDPPHEDWTTVRSGVPTDPTWPSTRTRSCAPTRVTAVARGTAPPCACTAWTRPATATGNGLPRNGNAPTPGR